MSSKKVFLFSSIAAVDCMHALNKRNSQVVSNLFGKSEDKILNLKRLNDKNEKGKERLTKVEKLMKIYFVFCFCEGISLTYFLCIFSSFVDSA